METAATLDQLSMSVSPGSPKGHSGQDIRVTEAFAEIERLRSKEAVADTRKESKDGVQRKERWRMILSYLAVAASSLDDMAEGIHVGKSATKAFKLLIQMEQARHDNCEQIIHQCYSIGRLVGMFGYFKSIVPNEDAETEFKRCIADIGRCIEAFALFAKFYYADCKRTLFRLWNSAGIKNKLEDFSARFEGYRSRLHTLLRAQSTLEVDRQFSDESEKRESEISAAIRARFGPPLKGREADAEALIGRWGRDSILQDRKKLDELAALLDDRITESTRDMMRANVDELLQNRAEAFHRRFESSMLNIEGVYLAKLDVGPCEVISDPDIKEVWRKNKWKLSVKARRFVHELGDHFQEKFQEERRVAGISTDSWTLPILSRVLHHSAIGDAIDEDGSGFISLQEIEGFSRRRPTGISLPEWLVYWAIGWRINSLKYTTSILVSLDAILDRCRKAARVVRVEDVREAIRLYLAKLDTIRNIISWAGPNDDIRQCHVSGPDDIQLCNLTARIGDSDAAETRKRWEEIEWKVDEPADLATLFRGSEIRIEQSFLCVIQILLEHQSDRMVCSMDLKDGDWGQMGETVGALMKAFEQRARSLIHGWRTQRMDADVQVSSFSGGICAGWYNVHGDSDRDSRRNQSFIDMGSAIPTSDPTQAEAFAGRLTGLGDRVDRLERLINDKMDALQANMASMLRDVLISDIMQERMMKSSTASSITNDPNRGSKPVINIEIPSVSFNDVVMSQNGSLHMDTPTSSMSEGGRRSSSNITIGGSPRLTRADSLAMSSFVQTASGRRYVGSYSNATDRLSSLAFAPSTVATTELIHDDDLSACHSPSHEEDVPELPDTRKNSFGLSTPTSITSQSQPEQYYGGVLLIARPDPSPQLHIPELNHEGRSSPFSSVVSSPFSSVIFAGSSTSARSGQSDAFMGGHGYDLPTSAVPVTDTDSARSKASKTSAPSAPTGSSGGGFRGGLKSVKESLRGLGGGTSAGVNAGSHRNRKWSIVSPAPPSTSPAPGGTKPHWLHLQDILDVGQNNEWYAAPVPASGRNSISRDISSSTMSPPPPASGSSRLTNRFRRPSNATSTSTSTNSSAGGASSPSPQARSSSSLARMATSSPFAYMQKITGSQSRVTTASLVPAPHPTLRSHPHPHPQPHSHSHSYSYASPRDYSRDGFSAAGSTMGGHSAKPSISSSRTFGPIGDGGSGGGVPFASVGFPLPVLPQLPFGRYGNEGGPKSGDIVAPAQLSRWSTMRRSRSFDGIGGGL